MDIFKGINNNPSNFKEAKNNIDILNKNAVKSQNKAKKKEVKRW